jgi:hypothetical protein
VLSIADALACFCVCGVLGGLVWTLPLQLLHFGSTPLYALVGQSSGGAPVGSPHVVGDGAGGDRFALSPPFLGGVGLARAAACGTFDRFGALD